jgi:arylsulfatase A-like enzyme
VALLLRQRARTGRPLAVRWCVAAGLSALALLAASGFTIGRQQLVVTTLLARSVVVRHLIGPIQRSIDRDGDGHGVWFGGGDCDDRDATIHPSAVEVPGNGIDENCSGEDAPRPALIAPPTELADPPRRSSVLFFSIDAARPDHLSAYGYSRPTTPNLSRFGVRAARFVHAYSTSPQSIPSLAAVFTGRYSSTLAWGADGPFRALEPTNTTLAELMRTKGYATAAFLNTSYFSLTNGFFQGFELVAEGPLFKDDEVTAVRRAASWLDERRRREEPFFAWIHIINPHAPYQDHSVPQDFGHAEIDRYDEEIARADAAFAVVLTEIDMLERDGQPVLVVVLADHGEAFGEHGRFHHAQDLHDEAIRVPLMIRGPGVVAGERRALASLVDLQATALWFAGLPQVQRTASRSLATVLLTPDRCAASATCVRDSLGAEVHPQHDCTASMRTLVAPPWKVIYDVHHNAWELYNLAADPRELHNLFDAYPARAAAMRAQLLDAVEHRHSPARSAAADLAQTGRDEPEAR